MTDTSGRLLRLLSLLQTPREWPGSELAERLEVSPRTVRRDIERLRDLGYPVEATMGAAGGYRLVAGAAMPPLLLEDDEAVAIAVGLRVAAGQAITGIEEAAVRALTKLEQVLPSRLRYRVGALSHSTEAFVLPPALSGDAVVQVDPGHLTLLGAAVANRERVRFQYAGHDGTTTRRHVDPHRLVANGRRWYLVGYANDRADWRTFRVDRITSPVATGARIAPRDLPAHDAASYVRDSMFSAAPTYRPVITLRLRADEAARRLGRAAGDITPVDEENCRVHMAADTLAWTAIRLLFLDADFEVHEPTELINHLQKLKSRLP